jgi:hypothetical protein
MTPRDQITALKESMQSELETEGDAVKRRELVLAINGLFDLMQLKGESK